MQAMRLIAPGELRQEDLPLPEPGPGQVLVRIRAAGICHTDVEIVHGNYRVPLPRVLGHELSGRVAALGTGVTGWYPGQAVGVYPPRFCGECLPCRQGNSRHCTSFRCLGNTEDGGWAEYTVVQASQIHDLGSISFLEGAWLEPLACVLHALDRLPATAFHRSLVIGAGPNGLLFTQALQAQGSSTIVVVDPNLPNLRTAEQTGANAVFQVARQGETAAVDAALQDLLVGGATLVVDTTGKAISVERALRWAAPRGTILLFGVSHPHARFDLPLRDFFDRELVLMSSVGSDQRAYLRGLQWLQEGILSTSSLNWKIIQLSEIPSAIAQLSQPGAKGKILVEFVDT